MSRCAHARAVAGEGVPDPGPHGGPAPCPSIAVIAGVVLMLRQDRALRSMCTGAPCEADVPTLTTRSFCIPPSLPPFLTPSLLPPPPSPLQMTS